MVSFSKELSVDLVLHDTLSHGLRGAGNEFRRFAHEASEGAEQSKTAMAALRIGTHLLTGAVIGLAAGAIGSLIESFTEGNKKAKELKDSLNTLQLVTSGTTTLFSQFAATLEKSVGVPANESAAALKQLYASTIQAQQGTNAAKAAFISLGVSFVDAEGNARDLTEVLQDISKAVKKAKDESSANRAAFTLVGEEGLKNIKKLDGLLEPTVDLTDDLARGFFEARKTFANVSPEIVLKGLQSEEEAKKQAIEDWKAYADSILKEYKRVDEATKKSTADFKESYKGLNDSIFQSETELADPLKKINLLYDKRAETIANLTDIANQNEGDAASLADKQKKALEENELARDKAIAGLDEQAKAFKELGKNARNALVNGIADGATKAIFEFEKVGDAVKALTKQIAEDLTRAIIRFGVAAGLNAIFPGAGFLAAAAGAKGGVTQKTGTFKGYAGGGIATEPLFLVGEGKNAEAVIPLPDNRSVPVTLKDQGGRGRSVVNVNLAINAIDTRSVSEALDDHRRTIVDIVNNAIRYDYPTRNRIREAIG